MKLEEVRISKIIVSNNRHRKTSKATVDSLMSSILEIGLQNPIGLTSDFRLIHGRHRLEAYRALNWDTIPATIHDVSDIEAELAEIDENIQRKQLTAAEECKALARRKELYLVKHPETKQGGDRKSKAKNQNEKTSFCSFASDTAAKTGKTERTVQLDVAIGNALPDEIIDKIADTPVANNKSELKKLAKLEPDEQQTVATMLSEGEVKSVTEAIATHDEPEPEPSEVLLSRVKSCVEKWRREFRSSLSLAAVVLENYVTALRSVE